MSRYEDIQDMLVQGEQHSDKLDELCEAIEEQNKILLMTPAERQEYRRQKEKHERMLREERLRVHVVATSPKKEGYQKDGGGGYLGGVG